MGVGDIKYVVTVDSTGALKHIQDFDKAIEGLQKDTTAASGSSRAFGSELTSKLIPSFTIASLAADAIRGGFRKVTQAMGDTLQASIAQEDADRSLRAALELTGREVESNAAHYKEYASELQNATIYGDEQIQSIQTLLLQMTSLSQDGIDRATRGTLGLASALGMDLNAAALLVQKAMAGQFATLSRYGIVLDENLSAEEKKAQLLEKLDVLYGRATAATETFSGRIAQLKNAWGDAQEEIGNAIVKNEKVLMAIRDVTGVIKEATPEIGEYVAGLAEFAGTAVKVFADALEWAQKLRESIGGKGGQVSESERAWDNLSKKLGGFSGVVQQVNANILRLGQYGQESRDIVAGMGDKLWESFNEVGERATLAAIAAGKFGDEAKRALEIVGGESLKVALKKTSDGIRDTGTAAQEAVPYVDSLIDRFNRLDDDLRRFRMFGVNIAAPISKSFGTLGDAVGGVMGQVINFQETVPDLFSFLSDGTAKAAEEATGMSDAWDSAMMSMTAGLISFGDANATIWANIGSVFENFTKSFISGAESIVLKEIWMATMASRADRVEAQSAVAKWWLKILPPPFSYIAAAASFAVVNALFSKLLKFEKGGYFTQATLLPAHVVGEGGPEYYLPEAKLERTLERVIVRERGDGVGGGGVSIAISPGAVVINAQTLDERVVQRAGSLLWREIENQARIRGRRWN